MRKAIGVVFFCAILIILAIANPKKTDYISWLKQKTMSIEQSSTTGWNPLQKTTVDVLAKLLISNATVTNLLETSTDVNNYVFFTIFSTHLPGSNLQILGILGNFTLLKQDNYTVAQSNNTPTPNPVYNPHPVNGLNNSSNYTPTIPQTQPPYNQENSPQYTTPPTAVYGHPTLHQFVQGFAEGFKRGREQAQLTSCENNIRNIAVGLQMFYNDYRRYPDNLDELTPRYLRMLPSCPTTRTGYFYEVSENKLSYSLVCNGHHDGIPEGYPAFTPERGLIVQP